MADVLVEYKGQRKRLSQKDADVVMRAGGTIVEEEPAAPADAPQQATSSTEGMSLADRARAFAAEFQAKNAPQAEAMRQGTARGLTLGLDDIVAGAGAYLGDLVARQEESDAKMLSGGGESFTESARAAAPSFQQGQDERRAVVAKAREGDPATFDSSELLASLLVPGGKGVKGAMVSGAVSAVGGADVDSLEEAGGAALLGGAVGGVLGKVAPKVVPAAGRLATRASDAVKGAVGGALERVGSRADELRVLTTMGATGGTISNPQILKEIANVPGGVEALAKTLRDTGVSKGITTTTKIAERAAALEESAGREIGRLVDDATDAGGFVDVKAVTARLRAKAAEAMAGGKGISAVQQKEATALTRLADKYDDMFKGGVAPVREVKDASIALGQDAQAAYRARTAGRDVEGQGRALIEARRASEAGVDEAITGLGNTSDGAYQAAKTQFQAARLAREAADTSLGRADKNNLLGLTDVGLLASTGPVAVIARKLASPFAASARATTAEFAQALSQRLTQSKGLSSSMGPWAARIAAAGSDPVALTKVVNLAMADPKVMQAVKADVAVETMKATPPAERRASAATALSAIGGPDGFSPKTFAKNYGEARGNAPVYGALVKEVGPAGNDALQALYAASKRATARGTQDPTILAAVMRTAGGGGAGDPLAVAMASGNKGTLGAASALLRDPAMIALANEQAAGKVSEKSIKRLAMSPALRALMKAAKMPTTPADLEAWVRASSARQERKQ